MYNLWSPGTFIFINFNFFCPWALVLRKANSTMLFFFVLFSTKLCNRHHCCFFCVFLSAILCKKSMAMLKKFDTRPLKLKLCPSLIVNLYIAELSVLFCRTRNNKKSQFSAPIPRTRYPKTDKLCYDDFFHAL